MDCWRENPDEQSDQCDHYEHLDQRIRAARVWLVPASLHVLMLIGVVRR